MSTDWKALCKELVDIVRAHCNPDDFAVSDCAAVLARARAALAQPEPEGPTDEKLLALAQELDDLPVQAVFAFARAVLARWGHSAPQPISVSERLPEVGGAVKSQWQLIETAPKDGTDVLVLLDCNGQPVVHIAWWRSREEWESSGQYCGGWDSVEDWEGWWSYTRNSMTQEKLDGYQLPTHWMPLPQEPEPPQ